MNKSKLGISVGLVGFIVFMMGMFSGYLLTVALGVFILCFEEDRWLRRSAVKAIMVLITFSLLRYAVGIVPELLSIADGCLNLFEVNFDYNIVVRITNVITNIVSFAENIVLLILAILALKQMTIRIPVVDKMINKYIQ